MTDLVLRSAELAELAGTTPRALRHYHKIGLLPEVPRDTNGYRRYGARDLVTVLRIRQLSASGVPLRDIGNLLGGGEVGQDQLLTELDKQLEDQAERIRIQRKMLADLRRISPRTGMRQPNGGPPASSQSFDHDVWTLATASGAIDEDTATAMLDAVHDGPLATDAAAWFGQFEDLNDQTHVDEATAEHLVGQMVSFGLAAMDATGPIPAASEQSTMAAAMEQLEIEGLSPAQQVVWARFRSTLQNRVGDGAAVRE
ncbi:MerR family DNA-binding transcriptional regulator [Calidifontibacter indicus]|uniref:helix-turn-helix domain-containing protein n=1 Tax=Calidifontibacter indicus TaxID=419650 RepID=UPI003D76127B